LPRGQPGRRPIRRSAPSSQPDEADCGIRRRAGLNSVLMTLRERVEEIFPEWARWYPSLFDAAVDLGVIRARVCDPSSLLLSNRHAGVRAAAELEHRKRWSAEENEPED